MYRNRARKYMAVVLSMLLVQGSLDMHGATIVRAADRKPETGQILDVALPIGGQGEARIHLVDDGEAGKVPALDAGRRTVRNTAGETVFDQGTGDYGYQSLTDGQQALYDRISANLEAFENGDGEYTQINLPDGNSSYVPFSVQFDDLNLNRDDASQVWIAFGADHPWLFWLEDGCAVTSTHLMPIVRKSYWGDADAMIRKRAEMKTKIEQEVEEYLTVADYYRIVYDKVREMDEMIIRNVEFACQQSTNTPEEADWAQTIEGAFDVERHAVVSEGYAKAFAFLLNILNIPNVYVTGAANAGQNTAFHAWNCVSFDQGESYYYMDLTWDDRGADDCPTGNSYQYFAMPKSQFEQTHQADRSDGQSENWLYDLPELGDDMYYTYFMQYGAYGTNEEFETEDEVNEFLSRVKALAPNRLSVYAMKLDAQTLQTVGGIIGVELNNLIPAEDGMYIWADPLTAYNRGAPNILFTFDTGNLTIDLGRETEKTLRLSTVQNSNGNNVRWHSDNNKVAVVQTPAYTKAEVGASVRIVAKKAGTAVIRAEVSNGGIMTCTVEVTGQRPAAPTPSPNPTAAPTSSPNPTATPTFSPNPTATPTFSPNPTAAPTFSPNPTAVPTFTPGAGQEASASPAASQNPGGSGSPVASNHPPVPGPTQEPDSGTATEKPDPAMTSKPEPSPSTKVPEKEKKVEAGSRYKTAGAVYKITGTGKTRTATYQRSTGKNANIVTIPSVITVQGKAYRVTGIGNQAFEGNKKVREVSLGKNIRSIGKKAFCGCERLNKVKLGRNVTAIRESAFRKCTSLTLVVLPEKVTKIGNNAFRDCKQLQYIGVKTNKLTLGNVGTNAFSGGYGKPRVKTNAKMWKKYAYIFFLRGLSDKGVFVIDPVDLVI